MESVADFVVAGIRIIIDNTNLLGFFVNLGGKNNAYLWLKYLIISTLISIIKVADVRIF